MLSVLFVAACSIMPIAPPDSQNEVVKDRLGNLVDRQIETTAAIAALNVTLTDQRFAEIVDMLRDQSDKMDNQSAAIVVLQTDLEAAREMNNLTTSLITGGAGTGFLGIGGAFWMGQRRGRKAD